MQLMTKRNLLLGNLVLLLAFLGVAFAAAWPLIEGGANVQLIADTDVDQGGSDPRKEIEDYKAMADVYPRVITLNDLFVPKVPFEKAPEIKVDYPPYDPPKWELVGIWRPEGTYYEANVEDKKRPDTLRIRKGARFPEYKLIVLDVTKDQVTCMASEPQYDNRQTMLYLTLNGLRTAPVKKETAAAEAKDWSKYIRMLRSGYYVLDMNEFEKECGTMAGDADWIDYLVSTVKAEAYRPSDEDADALGGYKIVSFTPESPLDDFGLQVNDIIVAVNRDEITGRSQARQMLRRILTDPVGGKFEIRFERATRNRNVVIELQRF